MGDLGWEFYLKSHLPSPYALVPSPFFCDSSSQLLIKKIKLVSKIDSIC